MIAHIFYKNTYQMNRRKFINRTALTSAGIGLTTILPSKAWSAVSAGDTINIGLIGCNSMGFGDLQNHLDIAGVNCLALCDVDENVLNKRAAEITAKYNQHPKLFSDFRKMLELKDIDAVIIGTPDHWHCLIMVYAVQAGKDVYVEKPMANTIAECNIMVSAARKYNRIVQVGQQQRSGFIFQKAMELIKSGKIGHLRKSKYLGKF